MKMSETNESVDDPGLSLMNMGTHKVEEGEGPWLVSYADLMTLLMGFFALIASFSKPDAKEFEKVQQSAVEKFGGELELPYQKLADQVSELVTNSKFSDQVKVIREADGVTVKFDGRVFFESGEFVVKDTGKEIIYHLIDKLDLVSSGYKILVEGHTDNVPISQGVISSNWELSGIRAARVAHLFEQKKFNRKHITIVGWGDTRPEVPNLSPKGDSLHQNQAKNRRVVVKISNSL
jgi:chemotaxis protein MotB